MKIKHLVPSQLFFLYLPVVALLYIIPNPVIREAAAQSEVYMAVRAGGTGMISVGITGLNSPGTPDGILTVRETLSDDLMKSGIFQPLMLPDSLTNRSGGLIEQWKSAGVRYLLFGEEKTDGQSLSVNLIDTRTTLTVLQGVYRVDSARPWYTAHVIVDDMIEHFTGIRGSMASRVAFVRNINNTNELFLIDADGRNIRQLTFSKAMKMSPDWSPDGKSIAYSSLNGNNWLIMMTDISTGRSVDITQWPGLNTTPDWSPVISGLLAFTSSRDGNAEIYTCRTDGKNIRRLTNHRRIDSSPSWSPDGSKIAFVSDRTGSPVIYVMNSDGTGQHRLTATPNAYEGSPTWSPGGDRLAFVMMSDYGFDIASCSPSGNDVIVHTFAQGSNEDPQWSPDGLRILFASTRITGNKRLHIMNRDGSNVRLLTTESNSFTPAWAPSGDGSDIRISTGR